MQIELIFQKTYPAVKDLLSVLNFTYRSHVTVTSLNASEAIVVSSRPKSSLNREERKKNHQTAAKIVILIDPIQITKFKRSFNAIKLYIHVTHVDIVKSTRSDLFQNIPSKAPGK